MQCLLICAVFVFFARIRSLSLGEADPSLREIEQITYSGHHKDGNLLVPSKSQWQFIRRLFIRKNDLDTGITKATTEASPLVTSFERADSEAEKLYSTVDTDLPTGTHSTLSPVKVPYDDYNYPTLNL